MRVLSIQQPWAWLIVNGHKGVENRDWSTNVRGEIAIHAGKKYDADGEAWIRDAFPEIVLPARVEMPMGGLVGLAKLTDCVAFGGPVPEKDEPWFFGAYGFVLKEARPIEFAPCRGQLGFFVVDDALVNRAEVGR